MGRGEGGRGDASRFCNRYQNKGPLPKGEGNSKSWLATSRKLSYGREGIKCTRRGLHLPGYPGLYGGWMSEPGTRVPAGYRKTASCTKKNKVCHSDTSNRFLQSTDFFEKEAGPTLFTHHEFYAKENNTYHPPCICHPPPGAKIGRGVT